MNRNGLLIGGILLSVAVSCSRQDLPDVEPELPDEEEITSDRENVVISFSSTSIKTTLDGKKVYWCSGDEISVWDGSENCRFSTTDSGERASFTGRAADSESYTVLYPYSSRNAFYPDSIKTEFRTEQKALTGSFDALSNISCGKTSRDSNGVHSGQMKNVGAYLKFTVGASDYGLKKVTLTANGGELISGPVTIVWANDGNPLTKSFTTEEIIAPDPEGQDYVCLAPSSGTFTAGVYYMVFCPATFSAGLTMSLEYADGKLIEGKLKLSAAERNNVYAVNGNIGERNFEIVNEGILSAVQPFGAASEGMEGMVTPWGSWTDASSLRNMLLKASDNGKTYLCNFKYYDYLTGDSSEKSMGNPLFYGMDFYEATGNYLPRENTRPVRENIIRIVKDCWKRNRAVCFFSWHLESPYAVYSDFKLKQGCRYFYGSSKLAEQGVSFPEAHKKIVKEILDNKKVDTNGITYMGDWFDERVQEVADMINEFVDDEGNAIPIVFRLWHEQGDAWAWWQCGHSEQCVTRSEYKQFYQLTVNKFREICPSAQILWGYGPNRDDVIEPSFITSITGEDYLGTYPGDGYVDIMGYDDYYIGYPSRSAFGGNEQSCLNSAISLARIVSEIASDHNKPAVIFETDNEDGTVLARYYTDFVQPMLKDSQVHLSVIQVWSSALSNETRRTAFKEFAAEPNIIFTH